MENGIVDVPEMVGALNRAQANLIGGSDNLSPFKERVLTNRMGPTCHWVSKDTPKRISVNQQ